MHIYVSFNGIEFFELNSLKSKNIVCLSCLFECSFMSLESLKHISSQRSCPFLLILFLRISSSSAFSSCCNWDLYSFAMSLNWLFMCVYKLLMSISWKHATYRHLKVYAYYDRGQCHTAGVRGHRTGSIID